MKKMRIVFLIDHLGGGGAQEIVYQLCKHIDCNVFEVSVMAFHPKGEYFPKLKNIGVHVDTLISSRSILYYFLLIPRIFWLIRTSKFDLIQTFLPVGFLLTAPVAWLKGIPLVHSVLSVRKQPPRWYYLVMKFYQPFVSAYIALEERELLDIGISEDKIKLSEVLLDLESAFAVSRSRKEYRKIGSPNGFVVLSAGRLHPDKGHAYAVRAWPAVLDRYPTAKLWIAGAGADEDRLRNIISELNVQDSVSLIGYQADLLSIYSQADIFLRTSINEGPNLVTLAAMAAGMPVIAFDTDVPKDYITQGYTGWVVPIGVQSLSEAIIRLLADPGLREKLGSQACASIKEYYDENKVVAYHEQLYLAVYEKQKARMLPSMKTQMWPLFNPFVDPRKK